MTNANSPIEATKARPAIYGESGITGLQRWSGVVYEEFLPALKGQRAVRVYKEMSNNDPTVGAMLFAAEQLIRSAKWIVEPGVKNGPKGGIDEQAAEFLESCMYDMSSTWNDTVAEILSFLVFGWSYHEIVYKRRLGTDRNPDKNSKFDDGRISWAKLPGRSQDTLYEWVFDDVGNVIAMKQQAPPDFVLRTIPMEKSLLFRTKADKNNPQGRSILRNAYRPWYFKKRIEEIEGVGVERDLAGLPVLKAPEGIDVWDEEDPLMKVIRSAALNVVNNIRRDENEGVLLPFGWELTLLSTGSRRQFDTNAIINRYDQRISVTLLADVVLLGAEKVGSFALADVKKSMFATALEALLESVAAVFNQYAIPRLFALNVFPGLTVLPKLISGEIEIPDMDKLSRYITSLSSAGYKLTGDLATENYFRQVAGMPLVEAPSEDKMENQPEGSIIPGKDEKGGNADEMDGKPNEPKNADGKGSEVQPKQS